MSNNTSRFMMFMIPNIKEENWMPSAEAVAAMSKYNESLTKAGVLLSLDGLQPPAKGARVSFSGGKPKITDGPFAGAKEAIGGYWMIQAKSKAEAVEWASRCPAADGDVIEVRQVFEMSDFPPEVQKAAGGRIQVYRVYIQATPQAIWDALTKPEWTLKYGYAPLVEYDLRAGGKFRAYPNEGMKQFPGVPDVLIDGEVIETIPPRKLVLTWRMLMDPELAAEGFTRLIYEIEAVRGGVTKLTLTHDVTGAPKLAALVAGECESGGAGGGWYEVLSGLKTLLETGVQLPFQSGPQKR